MPVRGYGPAMLSVGSSLAATADRTALNGIAGSAGRGATSGTGGPGATRAGLALAAAAGTEGDAAVKAYEAAAQKLAANAAGNTTPPDPQTAAEIAQLKSTDAAVRAHEAAHVGAGGSHIRGGANFTYQTGPDGKQYAIGGEVGIDTSPVAGNPQATIQKMATVRAAALAPADPSAADRAVAAAAAQQEAQARLELLAGQNDGSAENPGRAGADLSEGRGYDPVTEFLNQQAKELYGAFAAGRRATEPSFSAAA